MDIISNQIKMLVQMFLILFILNNYTGTAMLEQFYLKILKFNSALQTHIITQLQGITVYQCFEECYYRRKCKSFNYRRKFKLCTLNSIDSSGNMELVKTHGFVYSEKSLWDMSTLSDKCNECMEHERCWPESSTKACVKQECSLPETGAHERLLGNLFSVGNKLKVVNDNSGDEKIYTCSELPDIGAVLGGACIHACVMENSECQADKCSCLSGHNEVDGHCIPGIGTALGGRCVYSCAMEHSECQLGTCSCSSGYQKVDDDCIAEPGIILGGECLYSCNMEHSGCQGGTCLCLSGYVNAGGYCLTDIDTCIKDVAFKKTVTMSSDYSAPPPGTTTTWPNAVNGVNNGEWYDESCSCTEYQANSYPWLLLDLEGSYIISGMKIVNRKDCCPERLRNLHIEIGSSVEERYEILNYPGIVPAILDIKFDVIHTGRYVRIWQQAYGWLTICGLQVFGCNMQLSPFKDCNDVKDNDFTVSGVYKLNSLGSSEEFNVYCDLTTDGGGWLVFQRREDGSVDFFRNWTDYENGFGSVSGEHWLGNRRINTIVSQGDYELRVDLEDFDGNTRFAKYNGFSIGDCNVNYTLKVSGYSGDAGDSLAYHSGAEFSTFDHDSTSIHCATLFNGAWWYKSCHYSNLNGLYLKGWHNDSYANGVDWYYWKGYYYSLKGTEMKIRRV